jgi:hypothetical protein
MKILKTNNCSDQRGVVSIITVVFLSIILSLITIAFVKAMISNQRQALDMQLGTQAYYAAESGINDVLAKININGVNSLQGINSDSCNNFTSLNPDLNTTLNSDAGVKYTCLFVRSKVNDITASIGTDHAVMYSIKSVDGTPINQITINWATPDDQTNPVTFKNDTNLYSSSTWGAATPAMLRVALYYPSAFDRNNMITNQRTVFVTPVSTNNNNVENINNFADGVILKGSCDSASATGYYCSVRLNVADLIPIGQRTGGFYIRLLPIYNSTHVQITGGDVINTQKQLADAQIQIDSTGQASDVYKRTYVRINSNNMDYDFPEAVLMTKDSLCKQFLAYPSAYQKDLGLGGDCSF